MTIKEQMYCGVHRNPSTSENRKDRSFRTMAVYTKKARLMNHLSRGWDITPKQAYSRFGIKNLRATMSNIKEQVERYGNWEVTTRTLDNGTTCYGMDFHGYTDNPFAIRAGIV